MSDELARLLAEVNAGTEKFLAEVLAEAESDRQKLQGYLDEYWTDARMAEFYAELEAQAERDRLWLKEMLQAD